MIISDFGTVVTGKTPKTKNKEFWDGGIPFVTPGDIQGTKHIFTTARCVSEAGMHSVKGAVLAKNAVCVSCIGNIGYVGKTVMECISNQQINSIIVSDDHNSDYVYYAMKSLWPFFKNYEGQSTTLSILNKSQFSKIEITDRTRDEEDRIADVLNGLDDKIEINTAINENLAQQAQAIYTDIFITNADPSWPLGHLSDLITVRYGKDHRKLDDGPFPVYGSGGVMRYVERPIYEKESVLIPRKGTLNNVMYVNEPFWSVDTMFFTEMKLPDVAKFVFHFVKSKDLASLNAGSAVPSMTTDILNAMELCIPDPETLKCFESIVGPMYRAMQHNTEEFKKLATVRDTLLPRLMSGELDVSKLDL